MTESVKSSIIALHVKHAARILLVALLTAGQLRLSVHIHTDVPDRPAAAQLKAASQSGSPDSDGDHCQLCQLASQARCGRLHSVAAVASSRVAQALPAPAAVRQSEAAPLPTASRGPPAA